MEFFQFATVEDFHLVVAWCVQALKPTGPYPILIVNGEQGSGKSNLTKFLRTLLDPNGAPQRVAPDNDRDLFIMAENQWVLALDNLSGIANWLSDALCRLSTGGGMSTRRLHSDREEEFFYLMRPILLNGIPSLSNRADLADRTIKITLTAISPEARRTEADLTRAFNEIGPQMLGVLLDGLSSALRNIRSVQLSEVPRMADFAHWIVAAEEGLGLSGQSMLAAYFDNRSENFEENFDSDPLANLVAKLAVDREGIHCTPSELLDMLRECDKGNTPSFRVLPNNPTALGSRLRRMAPILRAKGFHVDWKHSGRRHVTIFPPKQ